MSGGNDRAAKQARQAEERRLAQIAGTQGAINRVFDSPGRQAEIDDVVGALREQGVGEVDEQKANTERALKFALARGGLIGGSTQNDQRKDVSKAYLKALLDIDRQAAGVGADLQARDQDARSRLLTLATTGLDATTAAQQSAAALQTNLQAERSTDFAKGAGDAFLPFKEFADQRRDEAQRRQAQSDAGRRINIFGPSAATAYAYGGRG